MPIGTKTITPCLWFDTQAEEAATFYCSVFKNSKITSISRFPDAGQDVHHKPAGSVMVVAFELDGPALHRAQRRAAIQIRRGGLVPGHVRHARARSTITGTR